MKVKDLINLLIGVNGDMDVLIPTGAKFDGCFYKPCVKDSRVTELGISDETEETEPAFTLVPCGFFDEDKGPDPQMN
jgi:hypothetical protein